MENGRKRDALLRAALADLGERGTIDYGYAYTRGTRRVWRAGAAHPESVRIGVGYALHARCTMNAEHERVVGKHGAPEPSAVMHYARTDARDGTRMGGARSRARVGLRYGVRVDVRDPDSGRKLVGAIVTGAPRTYGPWGDDAENVRVRDVQRTLRVRAYVREGIGI